MVEKTCNSAGPKGPCQKELGHEGLHLWSENNVTSMWGGEWRKNINRTTWRSDV